MDRPGRHLCSECIERIPFIPTDGLCRKCGRDAPALDGEYLCEDCRVYRPAFDRGVSVLRFDASGRSLVNAFKFRRAFHLRDDFVDWLEAAVRARFAVSEIDLVIPMPSGLLHRFVRGYNPCEILASSLAKRLGLRFHRGLMGRMRLVHKQQGLDEKSRRQNVMGTFRVRNPIAVKDLTILVLDDIMTTGSTLSECAAELKRAGAGRVWCVTLARSLRY